MAQSIEDNLKDWHSELNLFPPRAYQTTILKEYYQDYLPSASLANNAPIEFYAPGVPGRYRDLNNSKYEFKVKITKEDGSALADGDAQLVGPANNLCHTIILAGDMEVNGKQITDPSTNYGIRAYVEKLINNPRGVFDTRMQCEGWVKDTAGKFEDADPKGANAGLVKRETWMATNVTRVFMGRPHLDLFHQPKLIPPNVDLKFRFVPQKSEYVLITAAANADKKIQIRNYKCTYVFAYQGSKSSFHSRA